MKVVLEIKDNDERKAELLKMIADCKNDSHIKFLFEYMVRVLFC